MLALVTACTETQMQCAHGACISDARWCDGVDHCLDGSDEPANNCPSCPPNKIVCENVGRCYYPSEVCDGVLSCDGTSSLSLKYNFQNVFTFS